MGANQPVPRPSDQSIRRGVAASADGRPDGDRVPGRGARSSRSTASCRGCGSALLFVCVTTSLVIARLIARRVFNNLRRNGANQSARDHRRHRHRSGLAAPRDATSTRSRLRGARVHRRSGWRTWWCARARFARRHARRGPSEPGRPARSFGRIVDPAVVNRLTRTLTDAGCHVTLSSSLHDIDISRTRSQSIDGRLMIYVEPTNRSRTHLFLKRSFDVVVAGLALLLTLPIVLIAAVAIKLDSPGPGALPAGAGGQGRRAVRDAQAALDGARTPRRCDRSSTDLNERSGPLFKMRATRG